jgi:hypothetical protein
MSSWDEAERRAQIAIEDLRERFAKDAGAVMIFLGAGLSVGVGRRFGRATFETPAPLGDDARFPSWQMLIDRMLGELRSSASEGEVSSSACSQSATPNSPIFVDPTEPHEHPASWR